MTLTGDEWMIMAIVGAGLIFPFLFLYWLVYNAADDTPADLKSAARSDDDAA